MTLNQLFDSIKDALSKSGISSTKLPTYRSFSADDVRHLLANIRKAKGLLGYQPTHLIDGLEISMFLHVSLFPKMNN